MKLSELENAQRYGTAETLNIAPNMSSNAAVWISRKAASGGVLHKEWEGVRHQRLTDLGGVEHSGLNSQEGGVRRSVT